MSADPRLTYLLDRYGMRLTLEQAAGELGMALQTAHNRLARGTFPVPTFRAGRSLYVDAVALAEHQAEVADAAQQRHQARRASLEAAT